MKAVETGARILNDLSVGDTVDQNMLDALATLSTTVRDKLTSIEKSVHAIWEDQRIPAGRSETQAALAGAKPGDAVSEAGMGKRILECLHDIHRCRCNLAGAGYAMRGLLPESKDSWDEREWALDFVADSVRVHTDEFGTWLRDAHETLALRGHKEKPGG